MRVTQDHATFERDGVVLLRDEILAAQLREVIKEYERTTPRSMPTPKHQPIVVYWTHKPGERKRLAMLADMPNLEEFTRRCARIARRFVQYGELRLLETIIFNKPPKEGTRLNWHQDVSYFPFEPNNQIALWIPFDVVTQDSGAMVYALGTHKLGLRASTDLHSGIVFKGEEREPIPADPAAAGFDVRVMEMEPGDVLLHDGRT
jgi:ectoine hydroxylase-related dioxygenase (phytanoyl-CoA dioxygenase family)